MRLLLIQPTLTTRMYEKCDRPGMYPPLGLGYLAACARQHGHETAILDCLAEGWRTRVKDGDLTRYGLPDTETEARIRAFAPDIVGISAMFTGFDADVRRIAAVVKGIDPALPVVAGGADASANAESMIETPEIDLIIRGEGEATLLAVLEHLEQHGALPEDVPGTTLPGRHNPDAELIEDLNALPFPARDLLPMDAYQEDQRAIMPYAKRVPIGFVMSSRGCPYNCIFCSTTNVWRKWRPRSAENVVDEVELLVRTYGVREIAFLDDSFLVDHHRVRRICEELRRRKLRISWTVPTGLTVWTVTEDLLCTMRDTGFYRACFPIESGDPETLRYIRKPIKLDRVRETIRACHRLGIWTYGNFIIGFPEETPESVERTARFAETCGLDMISLYVAQPYAGSDMYARYEELGLLDAAAPPSASTIMETQYDTVHFKAEELRAKRDEIYARFTKRRVRRLFTPQGLEDVLRKVNTPSRFAYALRAAATFTRSSLVSGKLTTMSE